MKGNKIIATMVVLVMVLSTLVVLFNNFEVNAKEAGLNDSSMTAGVTIWQGTQYTSPVGKTKILNMTSPNLVAGTTRTLSFNGTLISADCHLYKPIYRSQAGPNYYVWVNWTQASTTAIAASSSVPSLDDVNLNASGFWFIAPVDVPTLWAVNMSNMSVYNSATLTGGQWKSIVGWFWVNSSTWTVSVDKTTMNFGENQTLTVSVKDGSGNALSSDTTGFIDMWKIQSSRYSLVYHKSISDMSAGWTITSANLYDYTNGKGAGTYAFTAYTDTSPTTQAKAIQIYGDSGGSSFDRQYGWNTSFGNQTVWTGRFVSSGTTTKILNSVGANVVTTSWITPTYRYHNNATLGCGPFDPPEYWADYVNVTVETNTPTLSMVAANQTQFWGFDGATKVTCLKYDDANVTTPYNVSIWNDEGVNVTRVFQTRTGAGSANGKSGLIRLYNGYVLINCSSWGMYSNETVYGNNGSWSIRIVKNTAGNGTLEWDGNITLDVTEATGLRFNWIDDDGVLSTDDNDGVIPMIPSISQQAIAIKFTIINPDHVYYGSGVGGQNSETDAKENITLAGDGLFLSSTPITLADYPGTVDFISSTTWCVWLTPTMVKNGGSITVNVDWNDNGTKEETLQIGGALTAANGSVVTVSPSEFIVGVNTTFTITVKDPFDVPYNNANISLWWIDDAATERGNLSGRLGYRTTRGTNGQYSFFLNETQQTKNQTSTGPWLTIKAPRNISVYVDTPSVGYGYALISMKPQPNLKVTMEPNIVMAGQRLSKVWVNTTKVDSTGNKTGYPPNGEGLTIKIYNSTGTDVTATIGTDLTAMLVGRNLTITAGIYFQKPGVYTIYAFNNTWNSKGHNGTLTVQAVDVTCDLSELIWNVDDNVTGTFTVKYNGQLVNGTLRLDNITDNGTYNATWYLVNSTPDIGTTGFETLTENTSVVDITITNGVGTVNNITAKGLWPTDAARKNITYYFKPKTSGSAWAHANGITAVKIANVAVTPTVVVLNEAADITITITGRGTGLNDVWVSIGGAVDEQNGTTTSDGKITFSTVPTKTGDITIAVENRTSDTTVQVTNWKLYIDSPAQVNEGESYTVTVKNGTLSGSVLANAYVTFNKETKQTTADGKATFTAPAVGANGASMAITATGAGYKEASVTIQINNVPKLTVVISGDVKTGQAFNVVIADDSGQPVIGATVTFEGKASMSGAGGVVALTAPTTEGSYPISATFTGFTAASSTVTVVKGGGIPGFELLTLVAAIGVAFLLLRRRRN